MLSKNNKMLNIKVSNDTYNFINTFSKKYGVSISSFCQDCVTKAIIEHDEIAHNPAKNGSSPDVYYRKLAWFITETYDERRK